MKLSIAYQQLTTPPPYAYGYTLDIQDSAAGIAITFQLEYLNRDTLSQEEIEEEGFTNEDDFEWKGDLGEVWKTEIERFLSATELTSNSADEDVWLHIRDESGAKSIQGHPLNQSDWEYLLQELMQAIYERSGSELPLAIRFLDVADASKIEYQLGASFEKREATLQAKSINWGELKALMTLVYSGDYQGKGSKKPTKVGLWVDLLGEGYYQKFEAAQAKKDTLSALLIKLSN